MSDLKIITGQWNDVAAHVEHAAGLERQRDVLKRFREVLVARLEENGRAVEALKARQDRIKRGGGI